MSAAPADLPDALRGLEIDHVAIAVEDLDAGSAAYLALGLEPDGPDEEPAGQDVRLRAFRAGGSVLELIAPASAGGSLRRFLDRRGPGLHHLALRVDDLDATVRALQQDGAEFVDPRPHGGRRGSRVVFLHPRFAGGVLIELVEP